MNAVGIIFIWIVGLAVLYFLLFFYFNNKEISLRTEADAQRGKIEAVRDQMFKVLQDKAHVSSDYRDAFGKIFPEIIAGRYSHDNSDMMKWIQEANPNFDTSLYHDLMVAIESQRAQFTNAQARMLDVINQRAALLEQYPATWFIKDKRPIVYDTISSTATKNVMATSVDDFTISL